ncbi:hypothetical protein EIN_523770 [Entamoeba invadens IP1]|uniref:Uncharacterized protein n=1 Tax=Entamoeba invadens IP1 TaxID=370355 RepID=A0A0A1UBI9_ENTIV|nr:hypothetical protein EIN_523770 [Entamoeba invadens IP1]ELP92479.1 hypothetical protein EIN_523770 [Entamoeba invadens IP1]|eukprot:XP_004259250.1 hypothetical protein EIN_523770 [Entamoeba invadens IP1]
MRILLITALLSLCLAFEDSQNIPPKPNIAHSCQKQEPSLVDMLKMLIKNDPSLLETGVKSVINKMAQDSIKDLMQGNKKRAGEDPFGEYVKTAVVKIMLEQAKAHPEAVDASLFKQGQPNKNAPDNTDKK